VQADLVQIQARCRLVTTLWLQICAGDASSLRDSAVQADPVQIQARCRLVTTTLWLQICENDTSALRYSAVQADPIQIQARGVDSLLCSGCKIWSTDLHHDYYHGMC
jgi:hypothetical protein